MAATRYIYTIALVARMLGEDEALLEDIAADMDPEDGCLAIKDLDDDISTTAFTGIRHRKPQGTPRRPQVGKTTRIAANAFD